MSAAQNRFKQAKAPSGGTGQSEMPRHVHSAGPLSACSTGQLRARTLRKPAVHEVTSVGAI
jgi:hypothetical protein